jgi:polyphosphate glucokinase
MAYVLGFDVGGSSVKAGLVDLAQARLEGELIVAPTPQPATPQAVMRVIADIAQRFPAASGRVGVAVPSVVKRGVVRTAANIDSSWIGIDGTALVQAALGRPGEVLNDADAAGLAEMRWGAGRGERGPVIMLTLGTGIGSALFIDGRLFPNTELGHLELQGIEAEKWASAHVRTELALDWPAWVSRLNDYLAYVNALFWPDVFILGGAVTGHYEEWAPFIRCEAEVRRAHFAGQAGVIGAALAASL